MSSLSTILKSSIAQSQGLRKPVLKLKFKNKVKRLPYVPETYKELFEFVSKRVPPFCEGKKFVLTYFDEEREIITVSDDMDY